jgi:hypothetical protein
MQKAVGNVRRFFLIYLKFQRIMKKVIAGLILILVAGCQENDAVQSDFTGNEVVYSLQSGSIYPVSGTATFKERKDGNTSIVIKLTGTEGNIEHPVHLHMGSLASPGAEVAALLTPVKGSIGKSETLFTMLADETPVTYAQLVAYEACIKVHLAASGPDRDIILAGGNIGDLAAARTSGEISPCKSE